MLGPKGEVSAEMALQAFALAVAPLPGVTPPAGEPGALDATLAVAWVNQVWSQLSAEQQDAITAALAKMPDPYAAAGVAPAARAGLRLAAWPPALVAAEPDCGLFLANPAAAGAEILASPSPSVQPYVDMVKEAYDAIAGHLGRQSVSKLAVCLVPGEILSANALARPYDAEHTQIGLPVSCAIYLNADTIGAIGEAGQLGFLMADETFACFQVTADPTATIAAFGARVIAPWVLSGTSAWAAATVATELFGGPGDVLSEPWSGYLTEPHRSLFQRVHSAIGFFAQVDQDPAGPGAWAVLDETLISEDAIYAFHAATGRRQSFIDLWAAGYFRDASRGADWDIVGPAITNETAEAGSIEVANGASEDMAAPSMAVAIADLSTSADITVLAGNHLRVHDGVQDFTDVRNQAYCTRDGGAEACACPAGSPGAKLPRLPLLNTEAKLALTGMEFGGTATITGLSLEEYCGQPPTALPPSGVWSLVLWSPDMGDTAPPLMVAYTCDGLVSTWQAIYLPSLSGLTETFELPFADNLVAHLDFHRDIPPAEQSAAFTLDYALDFTLVPSADPPVIIVTGTKTETQGGQVWVFPPREFGSDAPMEVKNISLETQLTPYPDYQHPFRAQALAECGG